MHSNYDINHLEAKHTLELEEQEERERLRKEEEAFKEEYENDELED